MKPKQLSWYPLYPRDWALSTTVASFTAEEQGVYLILMNHQWMESTIPCEIPEIIKVVSRRCQASVSLESSVHHVVVSCFPIFGKYRQNPRLRQIAKAQLKQYEVLRERGQKMAKARWEGKATDAQAMPTQSLSNAKACYSDSDTDRKTRLRKTPPAIPDGLTTSLSADRQTDTPQDETPIPECLGSLLAHVLGEKKIP